MKVGMRVDRSLQERLKALDFQVRHRILQRTIVLVTEELDNGRKHHNRRVETDLEDEIGEAFEKAMAHNRFMRHIVTDRILRTLLANEELRVR